MTLKLVTDEHIPHSVVDGLRRHGLDVVIAQEVGLLGQDDPEVLTYAYREGRAVYTCDSDYLALARAGVPHRGIIYHHQRKYGIGEAIRRVVLICKVYSQQDMENRVEYP